MSRTSVLGAIVAAVTLSGCGPSPEEVCAHADDLAKKGGAEPIPNCTFRLQMKYDTKRAEYDAVAPCVMAATDIPGVNKCLAEHQTE